jgi:ketosteroid isomerase-like protein
MSNQVAATNQTFLSAWEDKDIDAVIDVLADDFEYYETPFADPITNETAIRDLWQPVPELQTDISLHSTTLSVEEHEGLFRIQDSYIHDGTAKEIDRIFHIRVNDVGNMTYFMQWRESK